MKYRNRTCISCLVGITLFMCSDASASCLALVIGNGSYQEAPLPTPLNDAQDIATVLSALGFEIILKTDAERSTMMTAVQEFRQRLQNGDTGVFYFSGHGLQSNNLNYLLPVHAHITSDADVEGEAVNAHRILTQMAQANAQGVTMMILEACRDTPYTNSLTRSRVGLTEMESPAGSFIAYATAPGRVVSDDGGEWNSLYTKHVLSVLKSMPYQPMTDLFMTIRSSVLEETGRQQIPWASGSLPQRFCVADCLPTRHDRDLAELLRTCDQHFQAHRLTTGRGGTAFECYKSILARAPDNREALAGITKIEEQYIAWAQQALDKGHTAKAREYVARLRVVNPESEGLATLERQVHTRLPTFEEYPVTDHYLGKNAPLMLTESDTSYRTRLREAAQLMPNFAGHYILTTWGCGASCVMGAAIDANTGNVYWIPFTVCCWESEVREPVEFRLDSRLIVFSGMRNERPGDRGSHFYHITKDDGFEYIRSMLNTER